jgi:SAM-dependent methyltransferase
MSQTRFDGQVARALEATYQTPDLIAQRVRTLDLLEPRPGERILDVGVGPGLLAYDLARLVGSEGRVLGIDVSEDMLALARARLADLPQAELRLADAGALGAPDAAFDAAVSTQVHEYVADMPAALAELARVLRPGGRLLMLDTDWRSIVWHSSDEARMARVLQVWDGHLADPHLPARLGPLLRDAGFELRRVEVFPILSPQWRPVSYAAGIVTSIRDYALRHGPARGLPREEVEAWWADHEAQVAQGRFFFSLNRYLFLATR